MPNCFGNESSRPLINEEVDEQGYESGGALTVKSVTEGGTTTDEEIESRLSRRSSVLVDLMSLFRRSSSVLQRHTLSTKFMSGDEEDEDDEEETRNMSKDRILEAIRHKREIIGKLRSQPWSMKRKRRTLKVAQRHLQRQEAKVSKVRLYKAEAGRKLTQMSRWFDNFKIYLIPWEAKIKRIESHFGSVVSSYFTFLRWTLGVNIIMTLIMLLFVIIPEWLADSRMEIGSERYNRTFAMKVMPPDVRKRADEISTVWDFGGYVQYSLVFYGYYSRETFFGETIKYRVPVAYFLVNIFVLGYSFFTILRKMASNARNSKLSSGKTEQYLFNWKSFTGWDFTIGNAETAGNVHMANVIKFREAIAEYNVNMKKKFRWVQIFLRLVANIIVFLMMGFSVWVILAMSKIKEADTFIKQNAVSITVSFITLIYPNIFDLIGKMEQYHPRSALRIQLARVLCLYIVNYYTLIVSLMIKLNDLESERKVLEDSHKLAMEKSILHHAGNASFSRSLRQILGLPTPTPHQYFRYEPVTTTPKPPPVWTTVFSDFGPLGVSNPKAVMSRDNLDHNGPIVVTQVLGPNLNWNATEVRVNYSSGPSVTYTQNYRMPAYKDMCWETIIGQEITKLVTMDLLMTIAAILVIDFLRGLMCRYCNTWWCWNLEKTFPEYGEFKVAENVLHLVNNQGMIWLGLFFVPMLPIFNNIKLIILMYVRAWAVMTCNVPARQIFRASRSSNFYLMLLLLMLFLCTLPVGYVIASRKPSKMCGPFGDQTHFYSVITNVLNENLPANLVEAIKYMMSPGIVIPVLVLLLLVIYFLFALIRGLREANTDLTTQLMHERTEEKKKIFELAGGKKKQDKGRLPKNLKNEASVKPVFSTGNQYSSDDDSQSHSRPSKRMERHFVPSLGSVSEVDHSDGEEHEDEDLSEHQHPPPKLSIRQQILVCIGWADPREYDPVIMEEPMQLEEGRNRSKERGILEEEDEDEEDEEDSDRHSSENRYLLPKMERSADKKERSDPSRKSEEEIKRSLTHEMNDSGGRHSKGSDEKSHRSGRGGYHNITSQLEVDTTHPRIITNPMDDYEQRRTHSAAPYRETDELDSYTNSVSQTASLPVAQLEEAITNQQIEQTARRLLQPIRTEHTAMYGVLPKNESGSNLDPTRPPSADGSLSDPSPLPESTWYTTNPHSSYTSAMMSPIMGDMLSTDEGTDDEKARLIPDRPLVNDSPKPPRAPETPRAPRFRISMSPPRKRMESDSDGSTRRFEMRVGKSTEKGSSNRSPSGERRQGASSSSRERRQIEKSNERADV
ncbi:unnamed protein product [Auanema sp. JU1783]|nr:unnamed protein product [Auanema sp. JU1783]